MIEIFEKQDSKIKALIEKIRTYTIGTDFEGKVYIVGGAVRDAILGKTIKDIDIVVEKPNGGVEFATFIAKKDNVYVRNSNPVIFPNYGTAKVNLKQDKNIAPLEIECVQTRKEQYHSNSRNPDTVFGGIIEDANRRDLTINALYYNITEDKLEDFTGKGVSDIEQHIIRTPQDPNVIFDDDPLRILRTIRFSTRLGWNIEKDTWIGMINNVSRLNILSQERITDEINKMLLCDNPSISIKKMLYSNVLNIVLPNVDKLRYIGNNETLFNNILNGLDESEKLLTTRLAILFIYVGKTSLNKTIFDNYEDDSITICESILKNMKYPNSIIKNVSQIIKYHTYFKNYNENIPDKDIRKFIYETGELYKQIIDVVICMNLVKKDILSYLIDRIELIKSKMPNETKVLLPLSGNDIIKELNIKSGPFVGKIINMLIEKYYENPNITKDECIKFAKNELKQ